MNRSSALDAIRGVAILQVFTWHFLAGLATKYLGIFGSLFSLTWSGVDLFFVLSGFLIGGILIRNVGAENYFRVFYARRFLRIAPLYGLLMLIYFSFHPENFGWEYIGFYQNFVWAAAHTYGPAGEMAPTWSLAIEEQFYLVLPLLVLLVRPARLPWVCAGLIICAPLFRLACHLSGNSHAAYLLLPARMDALLLGVVLAWAKANDYQDRARLISRIAILPLGLAMLGMAFAHRNPLDPLISIVGCSIVAGFYACVVALVIPIQGTNRWLAPLSWAGLGAYSIYLFHVIIGYRAYEIFGPHLTALVAMAVSISVIAFACWKLIESPLIRYGHARFIYRPKLQEAVV
jgi:peptidoglycan/LPS O-acetylase OafA/YrhL